MPTKSLRPWQILDLIKAKDTERIGSLYLPNKDSLISSLETIMIISIMKFLNPKKCFEFGTFRGETSISIASNLMKQGMLYTLDIDDEQIEEDKFSTLDRKVADIATRDTPRFVGTELENKINRILLDSKKLIVKEPITDMDFIFVDGNHEISYVDSDTKKAFEMLNEEGTIVWHDYGSEAIIKEKNQGEDVEQFIKLKEYIDNLSNKFEIFYIENTRLAVYSPQISSALKSQY